MVAARNRFDIGQSGVIAQTFHRSNGIGSAYASTHPDTMQCVSANPSLRRLQTRCGIKSFTTIQKAVREAHDAGAIVVTWANDRATFTLPEGAISDSERSRTQSAPERRARTDGGALQNLNSRAPDSESGALQNVRKSAPESGDEPIEPVKTTHQNQATDASALGGAGVSGCSGGGGLPKGETAKLLTEAGVSSKVAEQFVKNGVTLREARAAIAIVNDRSGVRSKPAQIVNLLREKPLELAGRVKLDRDRAESERQRRADAERLARDREAVAAIPPDKWRGVVAVACAEIRKRHPFANAEQEFRHGQDVERLSPLALGAAADAWRRLCEGDAEAVEIAADANAAGEPHERSDVCRPRAKHAGRNKRLPNVLRPDPVCPTTPLPRPQSPRRAPASSPARPECWARRFVGLPRGR